MAGAREVLTTAADSQGASATLRANLWRDVPLFSIYGLLNNGLICVVYGGAQDIVEDFGFPNATPMPTTVSVIAAIAGPTMLMMPPMKSLGFRTKVAVSIALGVAGTLVMAASVFFLGVPKAKEGEQHEVSMLGFLAAMFAVLLLSLQQSLGENIACVRFQRCSKVAFSMWGAGTGLAGIIPPLVYDLIQGWPLSLRFLAMLPFFACYAVTCILVYNVSRRVPGRSSSTQDSVASTEQMSEDEDAQRPQREQSASQEQHLVSMPLEIDGSSSSMVQPRPARSPFDQYGYALYIGFVHCATYGFQYFVQPTCISRATVCKGLETYYLRSWVAYNVGVTLSRSSIAIFEFPYLGLLGLLQAINVVGWILEVELHFMVRILRAEMAVSDVMVAIMWYGWVVWVGLIAGGVYSNCLRQFQCSPKVPDAKRDQLINMAFSGANGAILASTLLGLLMNSTVWTKDRMRRTCP